MRRHFLVLLCLVSALASDSLTYAQGLQTSAITGIVRSVDGLSLPQVTVTIVSPALQGARTSATDLNGVYVVRGLPPGSYAATFELANFNSITREAIDVTVGSTANVDVTMELAGRTETITVTASAPSPVSTPVLSHPYEKRDIDALPIARRPVDIAELAPGLTLSPFNQALVSISGAYGFDNVFMVNGVDTNDNIFGNSNNLFIEDAIEEVTVLTGGISAEYGRFSGGVINIITKSGGNIFGGSFRENLSNPNWIAETPRERQNAIVHKSVLNKTHEGTFGGPVLRDRLWFFGAGRYETTSTPNTFTQTGGAYTRTDTNKRFEVKLTGTPKPNHTIQTSYINNSTEQANASGLSAAALLDPSTLQTRRLPNDLFAVNYNGVLKSVAFAKVQYSQKRQSFQNNGGTSQRIEDSPFRTLGATAGVPPNLIYHGLYFDATDPEERNNRQLTGSLWYLLSTHRFGTHDINGGVEHFVNTGIGGNSQSSSGYIFASDYAVVNGGPLVDAKGMAVPRFIPGVTELWNFLPVRGARIDIKTTSLYLQDRWVLTPRLTLDLGTRFEAVRGSATGDLVSVDTTSLVPRLAATFDVVGDGKTVLQATYGHYSGKYGQVQFSANTNVSRPSEVDYLYAGPAGQGSDFAPGFDLRNYSEVIFTNFPISNVRVANDLRSPIVREVTVGVGRQLGQKGYAKATYIGRDTVHFVEDFINLSNGITTVPLVGPATNRVFGNTDEPTREYRALLAETSYRLRNTVSIGSNYTLQLRNHGNFVGETANVPGSTSVLGDYPEIFGAALDRLMPEGPLDGFQRHKLRLFGIYTQGLGGFGSLDIVPILRANSGAVYSLTASLPITAVELARNPGYPSNDINPGVRQTVYFGERGQYNFKGYGLLDLAATYRILLWRSLAPWVKVEVFNLLNNQKQIAWDRTISVDRTSPLDANGIPTGYIKGPRFGQATNDNQFPQPYPGQNGGRTFRMAAGVRF